MNIQEELQKIHHQYGTSEKANYEIEKLFDKIILPFKNKAEKWDELDEKIGKFYENESDDDEENEDFDDEGDLGDIGEISAIAFGYL